MGDTDPGLRARVLFLSVNGCILGFCVLYIVAAMILPKPAYYPLERRWSLTGSEPGLSMLYYGQLLWGLLGAGIGVVIARLFSRRPLSRDISILIAGWSGVLALFTLTFCAVQVFA